MSPTTFKVPLRLVAPKIIKSSEKRGNWPSRKALCHSTLLGYWRFPPNYRLKLSNRSFNSQQNHTRNMSCLMEGAISCLFSLPSKSKRMGGCGTRILREMEFPLCIGALDGKHIRCHCPANSGSIYFSFHGWYSIVLMAVCSARYSYLMVNIGSVGSTSDGGQQCAVFAKGVLFTKHKYQVSLCSNCR